MKKEDRKLGKKLKIEEMQRLRARLSAPEFDWLTKWSVEWVIILILILVFGVWLWETGYFG